MALWAEALHAHKAFTIWLGAARSEFKALSNMRARSRCQKTGGHEHATSVKDQGLLANKTRIDGASILPGCPLAE
eukprot:2468237-Pyramimonas_sp.AAC.1